MASEAGTEEFKRGMVALIHHSSTTAGLVIEILAAIDAIFNLIARAAVVTAIVSILSAVVPVFHAVHGAGGAGGEESGENEEY